MVNTLPISRKFVSDWIRNNSRFGDRLPKNSEPFLDPIRRYNVLLAEKELDSLQPTILPGMGSIIRTEVPADEHTGLRYTKDGPQRMDMFNWTPLYTLRIVLGDSFTTKIQDLTRTVGLKGKGAKYVTKILRKMVELHPKGKYYEQSKN